MTNEHFIQQLVIERFKFHLAHLTAVLHTQDAGGNDDAPTPGDAQTDTADRELAFESTSALLRAMNEDLNLLERCLEQKTALPLQG